MTTPVQTVGPADPNAPTRAKSYAVLSALLGVIPVLTVFHILTTDQGAAIGTFTQAAIGLAGSFGFAFVANKTAKQVKNGTFDPAPPPLVVTQSPITDAFQNVSDLKTHLDSAVADSVTKVTDAIGVIQGAAAILPGGGLGSVVVEAGSLVDQFLHGGKH